MAITELHPCYNSPTVPYVFTVKTNNSGVSTSTQFRLPLVVTGSYNFVASWGDGTTSTITAYNQAEVTHTYPVAGTYTISITGTIVGWQFANGGDRSKMLSVLTWGCLRLGNDGAYFRGCDQLDLSQVRDVLDTTGTTNMSLAFRGCWPGLTTINRIGEWDMRAVTDTSYMFYFSQTANPDISNWNTSSLTNISFMMYAAYTFDRSLANWRVSNLSSAGSFMINTQLLSTANYDATLISWAAQTLKPSVSIGFASSKYSSAAVAARSVLTSAPNSWTIVDGGLV